MAEPRVEGLGPLEQLTSAREPFQDAFGKA